MWAWPNIEVDVLEDIALDPRNVRLEALDGAPESDLIQDLFANERTLNLVEAITNVGWLTHEIPIVVERDGRLVVVEGNRRIAALKAIQNPLLASSFQSQIARLTSGISFRDELRHITVKKAPSQEDADQLIATLHTGVQRLPWTPARQAAFFQAQVDAGKTLAELIESYPLIEVRRFVARAQVLNLFRGTEYSDPALKDFVRHRRDFSVSTLQRLYENDRFRALIGLELDDEAGTARLVGDPDLFRLIAEKVVRDMKNKNINTRILNKSSSDQYKRYMEALTNLVNDYMEGPRGEDTGTNEGERTPPAGANDDDEFESSTARGHSEDSTTTAAPNDTAGGSSTSTGRSYNSAETASEGEHGTDEESADEGTDPSASRDGTSGGSEPSQPQEAKKAPRKPSAYLYTDRIVVHERFPHPLHAIVGELRVLSVERYPNACMDLLRTLLEKSIKAYAEDLGVDIRQHVKTTGYIYFSHALEWLESHFRSSSKRQYAQVVNKIRNNQLSQYAGNSDHLNAINHNHQIEASPDDVRQSWTVMESLVKELLA